MKTEVRDSNRIRETLAASVLKLAGYDGSRFLLDPMCGSGMFSLEAAMIAQRFTGMAAPLSLSGL